MPQLYPRASSNYKKMWCQWQCRLFVGEACCAFACPSQVWLDSELEKAPAGCRRSNGDSSIGAAHS
jgi:hypothetical protein